MNSIQFTRLFPGTFLSFLGPPQTKHFESAIIQKEKRVQLLKKRKQKKTLWFFVFFGEDEERNLV